MKQSWMAMAFSVSLQVMKKKPQKKSHHKKHQKNQKHEEAESEFCVKSYIITDTSTAQVEKV